MSGAAPSGRRRIALPPVRGPWTERLYELLMCPAAADGRRPPARQAVADALDGNVAGERPSAAGALDDHDLQMALYLCYELHYSGIERVDDRVEWSPAVLMLRSALEREIEDALGELVAPEPAPATGVGEELQRLVREDDGPPLSRYLEREAGRREVLEHVVHRSAYQLKEADPHSWAIPRLDGAAKAALVEIQFDEYGAGRPERMHSALFAQTMRGLGLCADYGAYLAWLPGITLATVNLMSLFGLHRRWRGALAGHLAAFEMTSSVPNRRYAQGLRRLGCGSDVTRFYDEHVEADAVHESVAAWDLADTLARAEPELAGDVLVGARALLALEARWAEHLLSSWTGGRSSLLAPLPDEGPWSLQAPEAPAAAPEVAAVAR